MWTKIAMSLLFLLAALDLGLLFSGDLRGRLGRASAALALAPFGAATCVAVSFFLQHHAPTEGGWFSFLLPLGLPVLAFLLGFAYLVCAFLGEASRTRRLFALHTGLAIVMGVAAILALEGLEVSGFPT